MLKFQNQSCGHVEFEVMDVKQPLLSVARMVKRGYKVVFDSEDAHGSYMVHTETGRWYRLYERNGSFVTPSWVCPFVRPAEGQVSHQP